MNPNETWVDGAGPGRGAGSRCHCLWRCQPAGCGRRGGAGEKRDPLGQLRRAARLRHQPGGGLLRLRLRAGPEPRRRDLRLYGEARGRGAEYWGAKDEDTAVWLVKNDAPALLKAGDDAQEPAFKANLDAFAKGMSDYGAAHPEAIDPEVRVVLPVTGVGATRSTPTG